MNKSESITKLAGALSKAQAEMPVVKMNAKNPFLKSKYADLGSVIETSRPTLAKFGLSVSQFPSSVGEQIGVTTILMHESGEYLEESIFIPTEEKKGLSIAQSAGLVISYLRRYGWASVLGLYADEDTDGHAENKAAPKAETPKAVWTVAQKQAVVNAKLADNEIEAKNMLEHSVIPRNSSEVTVVSWSKHYRAARDSGKEVVESAQIANEAYTKAKEGK